MKSIILTIFITISCLCANSQTTQNLLEPIKSIDQANVFVEKHSKLEAKLFIISSAKDTSDITLPLFAKKIGYTFKLDNYYFKIIDTTIHQEFIANYIYFDGNQLSMKSIDSLRGIIIEKLKAGTAFYELSEQYTMDGNSSGHLDWFPEKMLMKEFETAVKEHNVGDIFTVDIPENKWYYVVTKPDDNRFVKQLTILKVKSNTE